MYIKCVYIYIFNSVVSHGIAEIYLNGALFSKVINIYLIE